MRQLKHLFTAALMLFAVTACDEGSSSVQPEPEPINGTVSGIVTAEGAAIIGAAVGISGAGVQQIGATDGIGSFEFTGLDVGTYTVTVSPVEGVTFGTTSASVTLSQGSTSGSVAFNGEFVRTSSISGNVTLDGDGAAGVGVTLSGEATAATTTGADGSYSFSGLKAGTYTVTINAPTGADFPVTSKSVTLGTGDAEVLSFAGDQPLTATVAIKSVTVGNTATPVNPAAVAGQIDVTVNVNDPDNQIRKLEVLVDGEVCAGCSQSFSVAGESVDPEFAPSGEYVYTILTAGWDAATGETFYKNGTRAITVEATTGSEDMTAASSVDLVFANADNFVVLEGDVTFERMALGPLGLRWTGGDHTFTVQPLVYSSSKMVSSVTVAWFNVNGVDAGCPAGSVDGTAPFEYSYLNTASAAACDVAAYQSPGGTVVPDPIRVVAATYDDGSPVVGSPFTLAAASVDNVAPTAGALILTPQGGATDCCFGSWMNHDYDLSDGHTGAADAGVGLSTDADAVTYHAGAASLTTAALAMEDAVATLGDAAADFPESQNNLAYSYIAQVRDKLGNIGTVRLAATGTNPGANAAGGTMGADITAPTIAYTGAGAATVSIADMSVNPAGFWAVSKSDVGMNGGASGFGTQWFRTHVFGGYTDAATGVGTGTNCWVGAIAAGTCVMTDYTTFDGAGNAIIPVPAGAPDENYWSADWIGRDGAGNVVEGTTRTLLNDVTAPPTFQIVLPTSLTGTQSFSATVSDNVELGDATASLVYPTGGGVPSIYQQAAPQSFAAGFTPPLMPGPAAATATFQMVESIEENLGGAITPTTSIQFDIDDVATNLTPLPLLQRTTKVEAFPVPPTVPATGFGARTGMTGWAFSAPAAAVPALCDGTGAVACATSKTVQVVGAATGPVGTFANPFASTRLYYTHAPGFVSPVQFPQAGLAPNSGITTSVTDNGVRTWNYTTTIDGTMIGGPTGLPTGTTIFLWMVGIDANGDAIVTPASNPITLVAGS